MFFSELYSAYYNAVAAILKKAITGNLEEKDISRIAAEYAFGESPLTISESFQNGDWPLLREDCTTALQNVPQMPLTLLQKRWLKAIALDPRMQLFDVQLPDFPDVEPLFRPEDISVFDQYADGDPYTDETYIRNFRQVLDAIRQHYPLKITVTNRHGTASTLVGQPETLEYSEKDDKFRVIVSGIRRGNTVNLGRMVACEPSRKKLTAEIRMPNTGDASVTLVITDERNALERVMLHFAHFAKEAEKIDEKHYRMTVQYNEDDETELVIRILSFGPMVKVIAPDSFAELIKNRLKMQKSCELS